jgi:phage terminase large subunit-like protein
MSAVQIDTNDPVTQQLLRAIEYKKKYCKIESLFPDKGKYRRSLYKKHLAHYAAGLKYRQRLFMAANRVGKTTTAGAELVYHLTGLYPKWWPGIRYALPQEWWVCGKYSKTVKDILQNTLIGPVGEFGSGLIPRHLLDLDTMTNAKKADTAIVDFRVKHVTGQYSEVGFRSYDQGRKAFEGTERCIWLDEEPPLDVFQECLARTMTRENGDGQSMLMMTFTPLEGMSETVMNFLGDNGDWKEGEKGPGKWVTLATWDDVPHLDEAIKKELEGSYPEYQRDARTKGIPQLGAGAVYPVSPARIFIEPFPIPDHFKRCYAMDFGFTDPTAILWAAIDPETDVVYVIAEHYQKEAAPFIHAGVIEAYNRRAKFTIPGVCDPSGGGTSMKDGQHTRDLYRDEYGIYFQSAINSIEPGISEVLNALITDKLKIFNTCIQTKREFQMYRRNEKGKPIGDDHLMDDLRYLMMSGVLFAESYAEVEAKKQLVHKEYYSESRAEWELYF